MTRVTIVNLGFGNLFGLSQALTEAGFNPCISDDPSDADRSSVVVLPGVGSFGNGIEKLEKSGWKNKIEIWLQQEKPLLGICLGMQMLFQKSYEFGEHKGLCVFEGEVNNIIKDEGQRVPKMGWYHLSYDSEKQKDNLQSVGLDWEKRVYFVHSYAVPSAGKKEEIATVNYDGVEYVGVVKRKNVWGAQFHPENSHVNGINFLKTFHELIRTA